MRARLFVATVASLIGAAACTAVLGDFEVTPASAPDGGGADAMPDVAPTVDSGPDAGEVLRGIDVIAAGVRHSCAVTSDGKVLCWGDNSAGQIGAPLSVARSGAPRVVAGLPAMRSVTAGFGHTCAIEKANPRVWCWGMNRCGQLGRGTSEMTPSPLPRKIEPVGGGGLEVDAVEVAAGGDHTCAVESGGAIYCWGCNTDSQVGPNAIGGQAPRPVVTVLGSNRSARVAASVKHTCAVLNSPNGAPTAGIGCWGREEHGALGDGLPIASVSDPFVEAKMGEAGANGAIFVAVGERHACAQDADRKVFCWGHNDLGQVGSAALPSVPAPVDTSEWAKGLALGGATTCILAVDDRVLCWGSNESGQLGRGTPPDPQPHPRAEPVTGFVSGQPLLAKAIAVGRSHACALLGGGEVVCWGANEDGQLGGGGTGPGSSTPRPVVAPQP